MIQQTLALTLRGLRLDHRMKRTHLVRLGYLIVIYLFLWSAQEISIYIGAAGHRFFTSLCYLNAALITLASMSYLATSISEEKEESTLGLLKMAGINSISLLLGKEVPRLLGTVILLSVQFPFTLLAITLGGITMGQVWAGYCALLAYLLFAAGAGLFCSVVCRTSRGASVGTGAIVLGVLFGPMLADGLLEMLVGWDVLSRTSPFGEWCGRILKWCMTTSIWVHLSQILATGYDWQASGFGDQVYKHLALAGLFFTGSWLLFDRMTRNDTPPGPMRIPIAFTNRKREAGVRNVWLNALAWKDFHFVVGGRLILLGKFLLYFILFMVILISAGWPHRTTLDRDEIGGIMMATMLYMMGLELAFIAGRIMRTETRWNTLQVISMLPISTAGLFWSKFAGCLVSLVPAITYFFIGGMMSPEAPAKVLRELLGEEWFYYIAAQYVFFLHLVVYLSLLIKWGALPLAIGIMWIGNMLCAMLAFLMFAGSGGDFALIVGCFFSIVGIVAFQFLIAARIRHLAGAA